MPQVRPQVPGIERSFGLAPTLDSAKSVGPSSRNVFGHNLSVNLATGNVTLNMQDISIPYHSMALGVNRAYDAQQQYIQIDSLKNHPNTDPRLYFFGNWCFQHEGDVNEVWKTTLGQYSITGMGGAMSYYEKYRDFSIHVSTEIDALGLLQSYGVSRKCLRDLDWQFNPSDCLLLTKHKQFSLLTGSFERSTVIDDAKIRLWQFIPERGFGANITSQYHYRDYRDLDGLREVNPYCLITKVTDGLGHNIELKPVNPNPPYRSYLLRDNSQRAIELILGSFYSYLDGNLPGGHVKTYLVTDVIDHTYPENPTIKYEYDKQGRLTTVKYPQTTAGQQTIIKYEYNEIGLLSDIINPYGGRFTIKYTEDKLDADERLVPRIKVSSLTDPDGNTVTYNYNHQNKSVTVEIGNGTSTVSRTSYRYIVDDDTGQRYLVEQSTMISRGYSGAYSMGNLWFYTQDGRFNVEKLRNSLGYETSYTYNEYNQTTSFTDALGHSKRSIYDVQPKPNPLTPNRYDLLQSEVENIDNKGNPILVTTKYTYKRFNSVTSKYTEDEPQSTHRINIVTDASGNIWNYEYNDTTSLINTRPTSIQNPLLIKNNAKVSHEYDKFGNRIKSIDPYKKVTIFTYDAHGLLIRITDPNKHTNYMNFDHNTGLLKFATDARGVAEGDPSHTTWYEYNLNRQLIREIDPLGSERKYEYFENGWRKSVTLFDRNGPQKTSFIYDSVGNMVEIKDAKNNSTFYSYDEANRLYEVRRGSQGSPSTKYIYDVAGRLIKQIDCNGQDTLFDYDALNRVTSILEPPWPSINPTNQGKYLSFTYDYLGNTLSLKDDQISETPSTYIYDLTGNLIERSDPDGYTLFYKYDENNRLIRVYDSKGYVDEIFQHDLQDRLVSLTDSNYLDPRAEFHYKYTRSTRVDNLYEYSCPTIGLNVKAEYNENDHLVLLRNWLQSSGGASPSLLSEFRYIYNNDNLIQRVAGYHPSRYDYDKMKKLVYQSDSQLYNGYDAVGNILWRNKQDMPPRRSRWNKYDDKNRLLKQPSIGATYRYDLNGNMISRTLSQSGRRKIKTEYTYDGANRLMEVMQGNKKVQYLYDADGLLIQRKYTLDHSVPRIRRYKHFAGQVILETDRRAKLIGLYTRTASGRILRRRTSKLIPSSGSRHRFRHSAFYVHDPKGNVVHILAYGGNYLARFEYDAWGNKVLDINTIDNEFGYCEGFTDPVTNLIKFGDRWYDPTIGRWMSEDRYAGSVEDPLSMHTYLYAKANPVNYVDRTGFSAEDWENPSYIKGEVNMWSPTQAEAYRLAQAYALMKDLESLPPSARLSTISPVDLSTKEARKIVPPRHYVRGPEVHDVGGSTPHYHVYGPKGKVKGHFFFGENPPRKEKSLREHREQRAGKPWNAIAEHEINEEEAKYNALKIGGAALGASVGTYLIYRGIRMLPSLLPPLWWTIPANVAAP